MKIALFLSVMICTNIWAKEDFYVAFEYALNSTTAAELNSNPSTSEDEPDAIYESGGAFLLSGGYLYEDNLNIEAFYADIGENGFEYGSYLDYKRTLFVLGAAARWKWKYFSIRIGLGRAFVKSDVDDKARGIRDVDYDLADGDNQYFAGIFSIGGQYPINEDFDIFAESTAVGWNQDDGKISYDDGAGTTGDEDLQAIQVFQMTTIGIRYYFNGDYILNLFK